MEGKLQDKTVLIAEDNDLIRTLVKVALRPLGCTVVEAVDGKEAIRLVVEHEPDLILLDVVMPNMDGFSVLEMIRGENICPDCLIVMLTTAATQADLDHGKESGANGYIVKPFDKDELRETVAKLLV